MALPEYLLHGFEVPERQDSPQTTPIQGQDALGSGPREVEILRKLEVWSGQGNRIGQRPFHLDFH